MNQPRRLALPTAILLLAMTVPAAALNPEGALAPEPDAGFHVINARNPVRIPSYSRQTKLPCNVCHVAFPQLTPFGRLFKLNGYTLSGIDVVTARDEGNRQMLNLDLIPPISVMMINAATRTSKAEPGKANGGVQFPNELSLFVGEAITPRVGTFLQFTYSSADGTFGIDNAEVRYANHTELGGKPLTWGLTLNNSPTVQDVWNSTPVWGFPYTASELAPTPEAATLIDGGLGQAVAGLGGFVFLNNAIYAEFSAYRSAPQGVEQPADGEAESTIRDLAPYWRVALTHTWAENTIMVGTLGMDTRLIPSGVEGPTDGYRDLGADLQFERTFGPNYFTLHGIYINEKQTLNASWANGDAANQENTLHTIRADGSVILNGRAMFSASAFSTTGSMDNVLYAPDPVGGSFSGKPDSRGFIAELDFMPWLNTRVGLQEIIYSKFNGGSTGYDGSGRNASANNTTYLSVWLAF